MSAKKAVKVTPKKTIRMGLWKDRECTVTKKKPANPNNVIVNIVNGPTIEINPSFIQ